MLCSLQNKLNRHFSFTLPDFNIEIIQYSVQKKKSENTDKKKKLQSHQPKIIILNILVHIFSEIYLYIYIHTYICIYVCVYICMYIYIFIQFSHHPKTTTLCGAWTIQCHELISWTIIPTSSGFSKIQLFINYSLFCCFYSFYGSVQIYIHIYFLNTLLFIYLYF